MKMAFSLTGLALVFLLMGAGCAGGAENTSQSGDTPAGAAAEKKAVPYSQVKGDILQAQEEYNAFHFAQAAGNCGEKGVPTGFSYKEDAALKYFIVESDDAAFRNTLVSATFAGYINFDKVSTKDGEADCRVKVAFGKDDASVTCKVAETEVCSGTYTVTALPR